MPESPEERRSHPRIDKIQLVQLSRFDEEGFSAGLVAGRTLNISQGGIRLELHHALPLRSVIKLSLVLGDAIIEVDGQVTYLEAIDEERSGIGIRFIGLSQEDHGKIDAFLATAGS